ncbi:hypothetical protein BI308_10120 [Roseofilum reptotaenium AO1-A]|uniref:Uncharacterized protein n=2 Tax=Roseofilum TaxID=1233426 RepID=A0A1L9QSP4_9CYAN|nr:hypothetical protein BI308_10120 [Roseofilum reptotaenium AO1-A]
MDQMKSNSMIHDLQFDYLTNKVEVVQVEIPLTTKTGNPWLDKVGCFQDDPTFDDLQVEIEAYRQAIDREIGSDGGRS